MIRIVIRFSLLVVSGVLLDKSEATMSSREKSEAELLSDFVDFHRFTHVCLVKTQGKLTFLTSIVVFSVIKLGAAHTYVPTHSQ